MSEHRLQDSERYKQFSDKTYGPGAEAYAAHDEEKWNQPSGTAQALDLLCSEIRPKRIIELGVGTGRYFPFLTGEVFLGVDVCAPMLEYARKRLNILHDRGFDKAELTREELHVFLANASRREQFDLVYSIGCIGIHVPVTTSLMMSISDVLAPGGYLFLQTTQRSLSLKTRQRIRHWRNELAGREDDHDYYCATSPRSLGHATGVANLETQWIREDVRRWYDKPILLSLFRKND